jgi:hypothetical protein
MAEHQGCTGKVNKIKLESSIDRVVWSSGTGSAGAKVGIEVDTHFVGNNSEVKIELYDKTAKKFDTINCKISGNHLWKELKVPEKAKEELYAFVKLPKLNLCKKSNSLFIYPPVQIKNPVWDKKEARRGDILKLTADVLNVYEGAETEIQIMEYDSDGVHDLITKFPSVVKNKRIEADWEYEYHEDTDDIPTKEESEKGYNPPEYFFRVNVLGIHSDSGILKFKDWIEIKLKDENGNTVPNEKYILNLPDGTKKNGTLNSEGYAKEENIPPGKITIEFPDFKGVDIKN